MRSIATSRASVGKPSLWVAFVRFDCDDPAVEHGDRFRHRMVAERLPGGMVGADGGRLAHTPAANLPAAPTAHTANALKLPRPVTSRTTPLPCSARSNAVPVCGAMRSRAASALGV